MTLVQQEPRSVPSSFKALAGLDQAAMDALPQAVYLCAADGRVVRFNQRAVELWGRTPRPGDKEERFCGSFRLYRIDGAHLPHEECPMATALQTGESFRNLEVVVEQPDGRRRTVLVNIAALKDGEGRVNGAINCFQDISNRKQAEDRQQQLIQELNHRIKNTFAIIHSLAANTARGAKSIGEFETSFEARLLSLGQAHVLLSEGQQTNARLSDLLAQQLEPFRDGESPRVRFEGPGVDLEPRLALAMSMVFHELVTNAATYGPLSAPEGEVSVEWDVLPAPEGGRTLTVRWVEMGGPPVEAPQHAGFGTRLIERTIGGLDGQAAFDFAWSGLQLQVSIPLRD